MESSPGLVETLEMFPGALCVSLTPKKLDEVFAADFTGVDCVEVRLDYLDVPQESIHARWDRLPVPVIATCRGEDRGGRFAGSIEDEIRILEHAARNGAQFVDIDYRFAKPVADARVIASFHDFQQTPPDVDSILTRACASNGQIGLHGQYHHRTWGCGRQVRAADRQQWVWPHGPVRVG